MRIFSVSPLMPFLLTVCKPVSADIFPTTYCEHPFKKEADSLPYH